jgi:hypothetical protein
MAGVVPALIASDAVHIPRQDVDNFPFSFVTPLKTDDGNILFHGSG